MITAIPVHNIANVCYAKEAENSHVIAIQNGKNLMLIFFSFQNYLCIRFNKQGDSYEKNEYYDILLIVVNTEVKFSYLI